MKPKKLIPVLLSLLLLPWAGSQAHAYSGYYYVIPSSAALRECAANNCEQLLTAYQGDRVEILDRTNTGWSKVRLVDRTGIGWIPSSLLSYSPDLKGKSMPTRYVNTSSLAVHVHPKPNSNVLTTLHRNEPVEMLGVGTSGWAQVRIRGSNLVGFVPPRYLSDSPSYPSSRRHRAPRKRAPKKKAPAEAPPPKAM